jgi:hypothetical protein
VLHQLVNNFPRVLEHSICTPNHIKSVQALRHCVFKIRFTLSSHARLFYLLQLLGNITEGTKRNIVQDSASIGLRSHCAPSEWYIHTHIHTWIEIDQLMSLALFFAQHVSYASTSIFRSLRRCVWVYCSGSMCVGVTVWFGWGGVVSLCRLRHWCLSSVGSGTQLSLRCNFSDYVLRNNYMFRPMVAIFRLSWEYLRATVSYIARY